MLRPKNEAVTATGAGTVGKVPSKGTGTSSPGWLTDDNGPDEADDGEEDSAEMGEVAQKLASQLDDREWKVFKRYSNGKRHMTPNDVSGPDLPCDCTI